MTFPSVRPVFGETLGRQGRDVAGSVEFSDAEMQPLGWLVGGQAFKDQGGVGEGLAAGDGACLGEVAGGKFGAQARLSRTQQNRQMRAGTVSAERLSVLGDAEEIPLLSYG